MPHPSPHHHPPTISLRSCFIAVGSLLALHAPGVVCEEATKNLAGSTLNSKARREGPALRPVVLDAAADAADVLSNVSSVDSTSFGQTLVDAVNAASTTETFATCTSGFTDLTALKTAACAVNATVAWDGFDAAYAAAGTEITPLEDGLDAINVLANSGLIDPYTTNGPLRTPTGCNFGCIPTMKRENDPLGRVAATLPWRGKCFDDDTTDPVTPTDADGNAMPDSITVPLVANVKNRIGQTPSGEPGNETAAETERIAAPAKAYVGVSTFDGLPALIIDYSGQTDFGAFRDEVRHVGCGVWLGKTYLVGSSESLAQSLSAVGGVALSPLITAVIERAMPVRLENQPPPWVLDFTLYASPAK